MRVRSFRNQTMGHILIFLFLTSTLFNTVSGEELCPFDWTYDVNRGRCIKAMDQVMDCENAAVSCRSCGGGLIRLENSDDQDTANDLIIAHNAARKRTTGGYFIDMNDKETTTVWKFDNGDAVTWFNWDGGQPNGQDSKYLPDGQHCMQLEYSSFKWHDTACRGTNLHYICMRKTGNDGMIQNSFNLAHCLGNQSAVMSFATSLVEDCAVTCSTDPCCTAFKHGDNMCVVLAFNPSVTLECTDSSYKVFSKIDSQ